MLVLHYTGMQSCEEALSRLCDGETKVSAHYLIDEDGTSYQLVEEARRAWHAGIASWCGISDVNGHSIGIELVNPGHEFGYRNFPEPQMQTLLALCTDILDRHAIAPRNVVGHSDVAPLRKQDPGELFDWQRLADAGIGSWPGQTAPAQLDEATVADLLHDIGYDVSDLQATLMAFQRHYRPAQLDGIADPYTVCLLKCLSVRLCPG